MNFICIFCNKTVSIDENDVTLLNYCDDCKQSILNQKLNLDKLNGKKKRLENQTKVLTKNETFNYVWIHKAQPKANQLKAVYEYTLKKYPEKVPYPDIIVDIINDEVLQPFSKKKIKFQTIVKILQRLEKLEIIQREKC